MKKYLMYIIIISLFSSCTEDFFEDKGKKGEINTETFYSSEEGLNQAAVAIYQPLARVFRMDNANMIYESIASDDAEAGGENRTDQPDIQDIDKLTHNSANLFLKTLWAYNYKGIYYANLVIKHGKQYIETHVSDNESPAYKYLGEAYFLRGLYYFRLNKYFGGVPLLNEGYLDNIDQYYEVERSSIAETFDHLISDLHEAAELLPYKADVTADNLGRATKESAWGFLCKAYLFESSYAKNYKGDKRFEGCEQHYDSAAFFAEKVIASPSTYLEGLKGETYTTKYNPDGGTPGFKYIFTIEGENSGESVFEVQHFYDTEWNWLTSKGNSLNVFSTVRRYEDENGNSIGLGGWGFNCPTRDLYNEFETGDPRLKYTIGQPGDSIYISLNNETVQVPMNFNLSPTGMSCRKYEVHPFYYWGKTQPHENDGPTNNKMLRMADIYLMAAEAYLEAGNNTKALEYVNRVRKRARNSGNTGVPEDLSSISFSDIIHERRVELALEYGRFQDLVRWKLAEDKLDGTRRASGETISFTAGKHEFFPIHNDNILSSNGKIKQNFGY